MEALYKLFSGVAAALVGLFAPLAPLVTVTVLFIAIDFVLGVVADRAMAHREGRAWYFESHEAWRTLLKAGFVVTAIGMMWLVESCVLNFMELHLTRMFAGMVCGVEMWSFLENASLLSDARLFGWLRRYVRHRMKKEMNRYENQ